MIKILNIWINYIRNIIGMLIANKPYQIYNKYKRLNKKVISIKIIRIDNWRVIN